MTETTAQTHHEQPATTPATAEQDQRAIDCIATMLGTQTKWSGADVLGDISNVIGDVRPHPGDSADTYRRKFWEATGREVAAVWDRSEEWNEDSDAPALAELEAQFEASGGRGVDTAEEIDRLRTLRDNRAGQPSSPPGGQQIAPSAGTRVVDGVMLYEKCAACHLFIADNEPETTWIAKWVHLHRGDEMDEALDATHQATPSGMLATLPVWRAFGPEAMRARFID